VVDVQGDSVVAHAALDPDSEGADLARGGSGRIDPAAGMTVAPVGRDPERRARLDHRRLERPDERPDEQSASRQGDDRVGDELARPVPRHLSAAFDPDQLDSPCGKIGGRCPDVRLVGVAAEGQDRLVLDEEEPVADGPVRSGGREILLQRPHGAVVGSTQPGGFERTRLRRIDRAERVAAGGRVHLRTIAGDGSGAVRRRRAGAPTTGQYAAAGASIARWSGGVPAPGTEMRTVNATATKPISDADRKIAV
jgi:hypothetical protein